MMNMSCAKIRILRGRTVGVRNPLKACLFSLDSISLRNIIEQHGMNKDTVLPNKAKYRIFPITGLF